jgi:nucleotide-binding universal stress UspA family protein
LIVQANRAIDQHRIDLLVVGNRGGGLTTNVLGSHTLKLIYHANCPVLSIPQQATFQPFRRIAFATDWHRTSEKNISQLRNLVKQFNAQLDVIHVSTSEKAAESDEAAFRAHEIPGTLHYLWSEHIEEGLQEHIEQHQNDLLVLIPHQHSFFDRLFQKSITRQMVYHSQIPLLTLRE